MLNQKLCEALECGAPVRITYFLPDERKVGGAYVCTTGKVKKLDTHSRAILIENGVYIMIQDLVDLEFV